MEVGRKRLGLHPPPALGMSGLCGDIPRIVLCHWRCRCPSGVPSENSMQSCAFVATWDLFAAGEEPHPLELRMIDFGSTPPTPEFNPTSRTHLANYRSKRGSRTRRGRPQGGAAELPRRL